MSTASSALVATDRPGRYAKQLTSHMARKCQTSWDEEAGTGEIVFEAGIATAHLDAEDDGLRIELEAPDDEVARYEGVVGRHLVRFGTRDELVCSWVRADGSQGSIQRNDEGAPSPS